jgi:DNA invertase Pin-like site-specific DNA recombinase
MKIAYSYTRFSSADQKKGSSAIRQQDAANDWCSKNGYTLSKDTFLDEGKSAFKGKHIAGEGDLKRFIGLVEKGTIKTPCVLILESFDRLSRLPITKAVSLFLDLLTSGVGIVFTMTHDKKLITQEIVDNEPSILYVILGEAQRAHSESKHKSERVSDSRQRRKKEAKTGTTFLAYNPPWCDFKDGKFVPNSSRVAIIKRIFTEYLNGKGAYLIAKDFNVEKIPTFGRVNQWYKKIVINIIADKRLIGYAHFLDKENYFPTVIDEKIFFRAQSARSQRKGKPGRVGEKVSNLFAGLCRCGQCGSAMSMRRTYKKNWRYDYLNCDGSVTGKDCKAASIRYELVEGSFINLLSRDVYRSLIMGNTVTKDDGKCESIQGELEDVQKMIERITEAFLGDKNPPATLYKKLKELEVKKVSLSDSLDKAKGEQFNKATDGNSVEFFESFNQLSSKLDEKEFRLKLREHLRNTVQSIQLFPPNKYIVTFKSGFVVTVFGWVTKTKKEYQYGCQMENGVVPELQLNLNECFEWQVSRTAA